MQSSIMGKSSKNNSIEIRGGEADRACTGKTCNKTSDIDSRLKNSTLGRQERSKSLRCKILTGILLGQVASKTRRAPRYAQRSPCCKARPRIEKEILHQDMKYHTATLRMSMPLLPKLACQRRPRLRCGRVRPRLVSLRLRLDASSRCPG